MGNPPAQVRAASDAEAVFLTALQAGRPLQPALESCALDFATWLPQAVQHGIVLAVEPLT